MSNVIYYIRLSEIQKNIDEMIITNTSKSDVLTREIEGEKDIFTIENINLLDGFWVLCNSIISER